jgi:adenosylmethionine-8-amino-7-oxononanoate aminotransferase
MSTKTLAEQDHAALWHPFTPMREWLSEPPLVIERAEGNELIDTQGRRYLDGVSSLWVNIHGHRHPDLDAAVVAQLGRVAHTTLLGLASTPSIELASKLVEVAPRGLRRVLFSDSGSTAVEIALKIAFQYQQLRGHKRRTRFLVLDGAYHGDTIGSVSLSGIDLFHRIFHPLLFHTLRVAPEPEALSRAIAEHADTLCAVVLEPLVQGAAGIRLMPPGLLRTALRACRAHGVLLVADEVATGFGRTGTLFACEQEDVTPDLLCCAKGLSGGYLPVAATLATEEVFSAFLGQPDERLTFFHGHSYGGNPLGCAVALASLAVFEKEQTLARLPLKIAALGERLREKVAPLPHVFEIRQKGMIVGIELRRDRMTPYETAIGAQVCRLARKHGVIVRPLGPVVVLMPPLSITPTEIERLVDAVAAAISEATSGLDLRFGAGDRLAPTPVEQPRRSESTGLFIAGTDTAVGKTTVGVALLRLAHRQGLRPIPWKPVETGCDGPPADARRLRAAARLDHVALGKICPFSFAPPVAPAVAAEAAGTPLSLASLTAARTTLREYGDFFVVEGSGGLLSPYALDLTCADLAAALGWPVLLVAKNALGTINHTALCLSELRRRNIPVAGVILVNTAPGATPDQADNARLIEALTGVRPLGTFPFVPPSGPDLDADALADALAAHIDTAALLPVAARTG